MIRIPVVAVVGYGPTDLAAFDAALVGAGVADRNLIVLSSVLPPASYVRRVDRIGNCPGGWGDRLYVVMAQARTSEPDTQVWAGIGWVQDHTGRGLLVEHHADSGDALHKTIDTSLNALLNSRGNPSMPRRGSHVIGGRSDGTESVCALVVAVFESAPWESQSGGHTGAGTSWDGVAT